MKTAEPQTIDDYIAQFPPPVQKALRSIRAIVRKAAPEAEEAIKYRMPTFILGENLVHFAGFAKHVGFYPTPSAISAFSKELKPYASAKGSVQFPLDQSMPLKLVEKMVEFRVKECRQKAGTKPKGR